jgi:hypothetical protein
MSPDVTDSDSDNAGPTPVKKRAVTKDENQRRPLLDRRITTSAKKYVLSQVIGSNMATVYAEPFKNAVDEEKDEAEGYYAIVKKPMYLGKIKRKVEGDKYQDVLQMLRNFRLILTNSI